MLCIPSLSSETFTILYDFGFSLCSEEIENCIPIWQMKTQIPIDADIEIISSSTIWIM